MNNCCCQPKMNCCCAQPKMTCCCCQPEPSYIAVQPCCGTNNACCGTNNACCGGKSGCNFSCLIILILILLVFSNYGGRGACGDEGRGGESFLGGKGIIFIIALFYLSCVSPCGNSCC